MDENNKETEIEREIRELLDENESNLKPLKNPLSLLRYYSTFIRYARYEFNFQLVFS